ncbi:MAG: hypothetical protein KDJ67_13325, partial [Nitratireductor sp.]|nr:hypothetical protein [Nitratireductor sp.]
MFYRGLEQADEEHRSNFVAGRDRTQYRIGTDFDVFDGRQMDGSASLSFCNSLPLFRFGFADCHGKRGLVRNCASVKYARFGFKRRWKGGSGLYQQFVFLSVFARGFLQNCYRFAKGWNFGQLDGFGNLGSLAYFELDKRLYLQTETRVSNSTGRIRWNLKSLDFWSAL